MEDFFDSQKSSISLENLFQVKAVIFPGFMTLYSGERRNLRNNIIAYDGEGNDVHLASIPHPADNLKVLIADPEYVEIIRETSPTHTIYVRALQPIRLTHIRFFPKISIKKADGSVIGSHFPHVFTDLVISVI